MIHRRSLFSFLASIAAVPVAPMLGKKPRDLVVTASNTVIQNCEFSGGLKISGSHSMIMNNVFSTKPGEIAMDVSYAPFLVVDTTIR